MAFEQLRTTSRMLGDRGSARSSHRTGSALTDRYGKVITVTVRRAASTVLQPSVLAGLLSGGIAGSLAGGVDDGQVASAAGSTALHGSARAATAEMPRVVLRCQGCRCSAVSAASFDSLADATTIDGSSPATRHRLAKEPGRHRCRHHPQCVSLMGPVAVRPMPPLSAAGPRTSGIVATQLVLRRLTSCRWGPRRTACVICGFQCNSCQPVCDGAAKKYCLSGTRVRLVPKSKAR